jgi:hypothetical protein
MSNIIYHQTIMPIILFDAKYSYSSNNDVNYSINPFSPFIYPHNYLFETRTTMMKIIKRKTSVKFRALTCNMCMSHNFETRPGLMTESRVRWVDPGQPKKTQHSDHETYNDFSVALRAK